jgi:pimeloyl-ACP methyl ester carboxylesterase
MTINHPERVESLTLLSTSPSSSFDPNLDPLDEEHLKHVGSLMKKAGMDQAFSFLYGDRWIASLTTAMQVITGATDGGRDMEQLIRETEELGGHNFMSGHGFAIASAPSRVPDLPQISVPTLIIHGTEDPWFRYSHAEILADLIPDATLIPIPGQGHASPREMYNPYVTVVADHIRDTARRGVAE